MRTVATISIAALALFGLAACDNGTCNADGTTMALTSYPLKGGGGGGGHGGGGHASGGEGSSGGHASGEGASGAHEGESSGSTSGGGFHWPWSTGHGSTSCKTNP